MCLKRFTKSHHLKAHLNTHARNVTYTLVSDDGDIYAGLIKEDSDSQHNDEHNADEEIHVDNEEDERAAKQLISFMPKFEK